MTDAVISGPVSKQKWINAGTLGVIRKDALAGLTVAALSLPQSMA